MGLSVRGLTLGDESVEHRLFELGSVDDLETATALVDQHVEKEVDSMDATPRRNIGVAMSQLNVKSSSP